MDGLGALAPKFFTHRRGLPDRWAFATGERRVRVACLVACHVKAATAALKGKKPFDDEPCEHGCSAAFVKKTKALNAKNICPPCITQADPTMLAMARPQSARANAGLMRPQRQ